MMKGDAIKRVDLNDFQVNLPNGEYGFFFVPAEQALLIGFAENIICATEPKKTGGKPEIVRFRNSQRFELCLVENFSIGDGETVFEFKNLITANKEKPIPVFSNEIYTNGTIYAVARVAECKNKRLTFKVLEKSFWFAEPSKPLDLSEVSTEFLKTSDTTARKKKPKKSSNQPGL